MRNPYHISSTRGFTLVELLIVIAIIGILVGIVVPTYQGSVRKANEAAAVTTLNAIKVAETKYVVDHKGQYGTFHQLFEEGYLDKRFNSDQPHLRGYLFIITLFSKEDKSAATVRGECKSGTTQGTRRNWQELLLYRCGKWDLF